MDEGCRILKRVADKFRSMPIKEYNELFERANKAYQIFFEACAAAQPHGEKT